MSTLDEVKAYLASSSAGPLLGLVTVIIVVLFVLVWLTIEPKQPPPCRYAPVDPRRPDHRFCTVHGVCH